MVRVYIAFGGNVGDVAGNLRRSLAAVGAISGTRVVRISSLYRTAPVGVAEQPDFINGALAVETRQTPRAFLKALLEIERSLGRTRKVRWGPRTIDLDVLLWEDQIIEEPDLDVPHPHMQARGFVLVPLAEIAPGAVHPVLGKSVGDLLQDLGPTPDVVPLGRPPWIDALEEERR